MIECPHCQTMNRSAAGFCDHCGTALDTSVRCAFCGTVARPSASYCDHCGRPLAEASALAQQDTLQKYIPLEVLETLRAAQVRGGMAGERRVLTMLFCDVKGSTMAAGTLDPEDWAGIMNGAFDRLIPPIYRYEGIVPRLMGDAVLGFFGAPIAHEDDPQRAVLAGLEIIEGAEAYRAQVRDRWGIDFQVRVGINTGLVVVGAVGSDLRLEYSAMGDAINLAARMEQTAQPGTVQISDNTYRLVAPLFEVEDLGGIEVKGKTEPVQAYRVIRPLALPGRLRGFMGQDVPLIGREAEFARISEAATRFLDGHGMIVGLLGEAGMGKSRLIRETCAFIHQQAAEGQAYRLHEVASQSYEVSQPYGLMRQLLRHGCGAQASAPPEILRERLDAWLERLGLEPEAVSVLDALFGLAVPVGRDAPGGEAFKTALYELMSRLWDRWAAQAPLCLIFDDVHWMDPASVELVLHVLSLVQRYPLLIIFAMRPDEAAPGWQLKQQAEQTCSTRYLQIDVQPLSAVGSAELVDTLLDHPELPARLREIILSRAEGNPFFVEEVVRNLLEAGVLERGENGAWTAHAELPDLDVPANLAALLLARMDRLSAPARHTLQMASVIGRQFERRLLSALLPSDAHLDERLRELQRAGLVQTVEGSAQPTYIFRHALTQDAAYETLLLRERRQTHQRLGEALEAVHGDQSDEHALELAHHFEQAGDLARTARYYRIAGDAAFHLYAHQEAISHYSHAIQAVLQSNENGNQLDHLYARRGRAYEINGHYAEAIENFVEMARVAEERGDDLMKLDALMAHAQVLLGGSVAFDAETGERLLNDAMTLAESLGALEAQARLQWIMMMRYLWTRRLEEAERAGVRALAFARQLNNAEQLATTMNDLCYVYMELARFENAQPLIDEAVGLWRRLENQPMLANSLSTAAMIYLFVARYADAISAATEACDISRSIDNEWGIAYSQTPLGFAYYDLGQWEQAIEAASLALEAGRRSGFIVPEYWCNAFLGFLYADLGDEELALAAIEAGLGREGDQLAAFYPQLVAAKVNLYLSRRDLPAAEATLAGHAGAFARKPTYFYGRALVELVEVRLALLRGQPEKAEAHAVTLARQLRDLGALRHLPDVLLEHASALSAQGRLEDARLKLLEACDQAQQLNARRMTWQVLAELGDVSGQLGHKDKAAEYQARARAAAAEIATAMRDHNRELFLSQPRVHRLFS